MMKKAKLPAKQVPAYSEVISYVNGAMLNNPPKKTHPKIVPPTITTTNPARNGVNGIDSLMTSMKPINDMVKTHMVETWS